MAKVVFKCLGKRVAFERHNALIRRLIGRAMRSVENEGAAAAAGDIDELFELGVGVELYRIRVGRKFDHHAEGIARAHFRQSTANGTVALNLQGNCPVKLQRACSEKRCGGHFAR